MVYTYTLLTSFFKFRYHPNASDVTFKNMRPAMQSRRDGIYPRKPQNHDDLEVLLNNANDEFRSNYRGPVKDAQNNNIGMIFANPTLWLVLQAAMMIAFDGTFWVAPTGWYQLFNVFFVVENHFFVGACILLDGKSTDDYRSMWNAMNALMDNEFNPTQGMADFELASRKSAHEIYLRLKVHGCYFHYTRAIFKNLLKVGLGRSYNTNRAFKKWAKRIMAIPLLKAEMINDVFEELLSQNIRFAAAADRLNFQRFKRYIRSQWQLNTSITVEILSVFSFMNATNNGAESFHSELKRKMSHKPNIWHFILNLNLVLKDKENEYNRMLGAPDGFVRNQSPALIERMRLRRDAEAALELGPNDGGITPMEFLDRVAGISDVNVPQIQRQARDDPDLNFLNEDPDIVEIEDEVVAPVQDPPAPPAPVVQIQTPPCSVCMLPVRDRVALLPCGHADFCTACIDNMERLTRPNPETRLYRCPNCNGHYTTKTRIYLNM